MHCCSVPLHVQLNCPITHSVIRLSNVLHVWWDLSILAKRAHMQNNAWAFFQAATIQSPRHGFHRHSCRTVSQHSYAAHLQQCYTGTALLLGVLQGMEKDIILLATTITHAGAFATDAQRVNVALTRARHHLIVLGSSQVLHTSSAAFRLLLSSCQMLPSGACLVVPGSLSSAANHSNTGASSASVDCGLDSHKEENQQPYGVPEVPAQWQGSAQNSADTHEQASASGCSHALDKSLLPDSVQQARGLDERHAAASGCTKDVSPLGQVRDECPAVDCPKKAVVNSTSSTNTAPLAAPRLMFDTDDV